MDFFDVVEQRRSIRRFKPTPVPEHVIEKALDAALLAPNSSNMQTWEFYWVRTASKKAALIKACLGQGAAATAQELVVAVSTPYHWKRNNLEMLRLIEETNGPALARSYYEKLMPMLYGWTFLAPIKWLAFTAIGFFRPIMRRPWSARDVSEVSIKSTALACENFMLAVTAQGFDSCPMEGFDEYRVKKICNLPCKARIVMVLGVGERDASGVWGNRVRFSRNWFVKEA